MTFYDAASGSASGPQRKTWDTEEFEEKAKERLKSELDEEEVRLGRKKKDEPKIRRDLLQARDYKVDLESKVGKAVVINKATPSAESGGFYCDVCDCVMKDSINFLDHINGKNHQRNMGMSMKVKKSTLDDVKARFAFKKLEKDKEKKEKQIEQLLEDVHEEEAKLRDSKRDKKKEDRKRKAEPTDADELDPDLQAMMGFGGFSRTMAGLEYIVVLSLLIIGMQTATPVTLEEKVQQLQDMMYRQPVIKMNMDRWRTLVRQQPRNYSMMVLFTALSPGVNCPICRPAYDEFVIAANSHRFNNNELKSLYFGVVDYEDAPQIFQQMNLNTAPILYHFGPKTQGKKKPDQMDFQRHGFDADAIARFVADQTEVQIRILRPPNYAAPIIIILVVALILGLLYMKRNNLEFLYNKTFWGGVCLLFTFIFMSGQMWNHIRGPPFIMTNPNTKETSFIHGSTQYQLIAETYIVALMYGLITAGFIIMNDAADDSKSDKKKKPLLSGVNATAMVWLGLGIIVVFFSLLLSIFRSKYRGYPYSFLFS